MSTTAYKRLNISLPTETLKRIDRVTVPGARSRLIDVAVNLYLNKKSRADLHKRLKEGYIANRARDLQIAQEWSRLDDAAWFERNK